MPRWGLQLTARSCRDGVFLSVGPAEAGGGGIGWGRCFHRYDDGKVESYLNVFFEFKLFGYIYYFAVTERCVKHIVTPQARVTQ